MKYNSCATGTFPSQLEALTYLRLCEYLPYPAITRQYRVQLTDTISWKVDFAVEDGANLLLVEAKGFATEVFRLKLQLLQDLHPKKASQLLLVGGKGVDAKRLSKLHRYTTSLVNLPSVLSSWDWVQKLILEKERNYENCFHNLENPPSLRGRENGNQATEPVEGSALSGREASEFQRVGYRHEQSI